MFYVFFAELIKQHLQLLIAKVQSVDFYMQSLYFLLEISLTSQSGPFDFAQTALAFLFPILFVAQVTTQHYV